MKHSAHAIPFILLALLSSCSNYSTEQEVNVDNLNDSIRLAASRAEAWTRNPESISKHLFPTQTQAEGSRRYAIQVDCPEQSTCNVTVLDEGPMDDEVSGQRWKARFQKTADGWQLTKLTRALKQHL